MLRATARPSRWAAAPPGLRRGPSRVAVGSLDTGHDATGRGAAPPTAARIDEPPRYTSPPPHGQHPFTEEAHPPRRARAPREPPLHVDDQDLLPPPQAAVARGRRRGRRHRAPRARQTIDKAVKRGALHRNTGARKKSRAAKLRAGASSAAAAGPQRPRPRRARPPARCASPRSRRSRAAPRCPRPARVSPRLAELEVGERLERAPQRARRRSRAPP